MNLLPTALEPRVVSVTLMALCGVVLALRPRRFARVIWTVLLLGGIANALVLNLQPYNLIHSNLTHYYLGAKYRFPYQALYRLMNAALERPQVNMTDLTRPGQLVRATETEQRAYYIDLLREEHVQFDALATTRELEERARNSGAVKREADRILHENLPSGQIDDFRRDVAYAARAWPGRDLTLDFGFNGSPFYALVRHVDPTLYRPLGPSTAWINLVWQTLGVLLVAFLLGKALGLDPGGKLAMAAVVFASWDFVSYALPGLVFAGFMLPITIAVSALQRGAPARAGIAIAWAGLIKLFPFVLLLPALVGVARAHWQKFRKQSVSVPDRYWLRLLVSCALCVVLLTLAAMLSGRSWIEFFSKVVPQFGAGRGGNNVSVMRTLSEFGLVGGGLSAIVSIGAMVTFVAMLARDDARKDALALPRRALVLLAALGWVVPNWLNYYSVIMLLLLPHLAARHRIGAAIAALAMAVSFLLPDFADPRLMTSTWLPALKLAPYVLIPAWFVALELRQSSWPVRMRRLAWGGAAALLLLAGVEVWRVRAVAHWGNAGYMCIQSHDIAGAVQNYDRALRLAPRDGRIHHGKGVARAMAGDMDGAARSLARAVELMPDHANYRRDYARVLMKAGRIGDGLQELEAARRLAPGEVAILVELARAQMTRQNYAEASLLASRARELDPRNGVPDDLMKALSTRP